MTISRSGDSDPNLNILSIKCSVECTVKTPKCSGREVAGLTRAYTPVLIRAKVWVEVGVRVGVGTRVGEGGNERNQRLDASTVT